MRIWDDGISTHIEIDFINQKYTLWERLTGKAGIRNTSKPIDVILVGKERQNFLDIKECFANPMVVMHIPREAKYLDWDTPKTFKKQSHHKKKPTKKQSAG